IKAAMYLVFLGGAAFVVLYTVVLLILNTLGPAFGSSPSFDAWKGLLARADTRNALLNTFTLSLAGQGLAFGAAVGISWLLARTDVPGKGAFELACWAAFFMPVLPVTLGWVLVLD